MFCECHKSTNKATVNGLCHKNNTNHEKLQIRKKKVTNWKEKVRGIPSLFSTLEKKCLKFSGILRLKFVEGIKTSPVAS